jgi:hypothetical protein
MIERSRSSEWYSIPLDRLVRPIYRMCANWELRFHFDGTAFRVLPASATVTISIVRRRR